jgi:putative peptidoglycan lipid II flippase
MARQWRSGDRSNAMHNQNRAIEFSMLVALPMMIGLMYLAYPLILVVFQRNAFSVAATHETAKVLAAFSSGLPAYILVKIFNTSFFSRQDTTTPIRVATLSMGLNVVFSLLLMHPLKHVGIALAPSIAAWTSAGILGVLLYRQQYLVIDENLKRFIPRVLICCVVLVMVLMLARHGLTPYLESGDGWWIRSLALTALVCIGIVTFLVSSYATGCVDFKDLVQHVTFNDEEAPKSQSYHSY